MNTSPAELIYTPAQVVLWDRQKLTDKLRPLLETFSEASRNAFNAAEISGSSLLAHAGDMNFFVGAGIAYGPSDELSRLASTMLANEEVKATKRSMLYAFQSCIEYHINSIFCNKALDGGGDNYEVSSSRRIKLYPSVLDIYKGTWASLGKVLSTKSN